MKNSGSKRQSAVVDFVDLERTRSFSYYPPTPLVIPATGSYCRWSGVEWNVPIQGTSRYSLKEAEDN